MKDTTLKEIETKIYIIRNQKVMLDSDLACLYGVETGALNRQVKRNLDRFPEDFMFQLTDEEYENLRCQFGISSLQYGGRRYQPFVFTENGIAMLSSVLHSKRMDELESNTTKIFKVVFERLDNLEIKLPNLPQDRTKIGLD